MKTLFKSFILTCSILILVSCATLKLSDQQLADGMITEAIGSMLDNNPKYKPIVADLAKEAKTALDAHLFVTQGGASTWLINHLQEKFKNDTQNPRLKRIIFLIAKAYMPGWESALTSSITPAQKTQLYNLINIVSMAVQ